MYSLVFHEAQTYFLLLRTSCAAISNKRTHEELHMGQIGYRILVLCACAKIIRTHEYMSN